MEEKQAQWLTNKDLFFMLNDFKTDLLRVSEELKQTREIVSKYNGLRQRIEECSDEIEAMKNKAAGQSSVGKAIREWGGWIVALISVGITFLKLMGG